MQINLKFLFIHNPISGGGKNNFLSSFKHSKKNFPNYNLISTKRVGHATEIATQHKNDFDVIVAVGGDGTINEVASALINTNVKMGIIPQGSGNGFANHAGISSNTTKALNQLLVGTTKLFDSVLINKKTCANVAGVGFDGHITQLFNKTKLRGFWSYTRLVVTEFLKFKEFDYTLVANNKTLNGSAFIIALANCTQYGNNFKIAPKAKSNDGLINVIILKKPSLFVMPIIIWKIVKGKSINNKYCTEIITKELTLTHPNQPVHLDGEIAHFETSKLKIQIIPSSLKVIG